MHRKCTWSVETASLRRSVDALGALAPTARLAAQRGRLAAAIRRLTREAPGGIARRRARLEGLAGRLDSLSPLAVLSRGYAMVRRERDGLIVRRSEEAPAGERLRIRVAEGAIVAVSESPVDPGPVADRTEKSL